MTKYQKIIQELNLDKNNYLTLVCVSKMRRDEDVLGIYDQGQRHFAENRVQELVRKHEIMPKDIHWHLIGRLQTNKVKYIIDFVEYIHSVDRIDLAQVINTLAKKQNKTQKVLIQFNISKEETKAGFLKEQAIEAFEILLSLENLKIVGLMTMAPFIDDLELVQNYFEQLAQLKTDLNQHFKIQMTELSMGMSHDYHQAIEAGATMLRIGSALFETQEVIE